MQPEIRFQPSGRTIRVDPGTSVLEAARAAGLPIASGCGARSLCGRCGVYVAAALSHDGRTVATLNGNTLEARDTLDPAPPLADYEDETIEARLARRLARWTPATVVEGAGRPGPDA